MREIIVYPIATLCLFAACSSKDPGDQGKADASQVEDECLVDDQNNSGKAVSISLTQRFQGDTYLCPPTDVDWFSFDVPAGQPLITIAIDYEAGVRTPVELGYDLFAASNTNDPVGGARDTLAQDNKSSIIGSHAVDPAGGRYFIRVLDSGSDDEDIKNPYGILVTSGADPDPNEPNNDCQNKSPLSGSATGVIGVDGDKDAFALTVPAGSRVVELGLTTGQASDVDFKVTLFEPDGTTFVESEEDAFGDDGTNVLLRHGLLSAGGEFCVVVEDNDGQDISADTVYTLTAQVIAEPDPQEQTVRNDDPSTATDLTGGGNITGISGPTPTKTGSKSTPPSDRSLKLN